MPDTSIKIRDLVFIFFRNLLLLTNGVIYSVVILLFVFGDTIAGIFLGIIATVNVGFGLFQDIRAWSALQKLQLLTAPYVTLIDNSGIEKSVLAETIHKGDLIKLKIGDQVPADGTLLDSFNFEINEGLITGESNSLAKNDGSKIQAGSVVTSGSSKLSIDTAFSESRIARMTGGIKEYTSKTSPIQQSVQVISKYSAVLLILTIIFVVIRGALMKIAGVSTVLEVGTMASILVPQGIAFMVTIFFAYGAAHLYKRHVLLQEVNATEKLGRIKNLCMDKTGTITENILSVKEMLTINKKDEQLARELSASYIIATGDSSQTIEAIKKFLAVDFTKAVDRKGSDALPFSSWRAYGAAMVNTEASADKVSVLAGPPQIIIPHIKSSSEKEWLTNIMQSQEQTGERILCFAKCDSAILPKNLDETKLSILAVFVFYNVLREGIRDTIDFFQNRNVRIRILSGDNYRTAKVVATLAGITDSDKVITNKEMKSWTQKDFNEKAKSYTIFASVLPEQKKMIIEALKLDGFTAMVGDGANDALAIKSADLGIAMWDGAPAVRRLASVVLTNNSFQALPGGIELAYNIILYVEMFASMFLNQSIIGLFLFIILGILNYTYPLTPFNVTLINYFTIGMPGLLVSYWVIWPHGVVHSPPDGRSFLQRVMPFATISAIFQALAIGAVFIYISYLHITPTNSIISFMFIIFGFIFFMFVPKIYQGDIDKTQILQIAGLGVFEFLLLLAILQVPVIMLFFDINPLGISISNYIFIALIILPFAFVQYLVTRHFNARLKSYKNIKNIS